MGCKRLSVPGEKMDTQKQVVNRLRSAFQSGVTIPEQFRQSQLTKLMSMIRDNEEQIVDALHKDLGKVHDFVCHMSYADSTCTNT